MRLSGAAGFLFGESSRPTRRKVDETMLLPDKIEYGHWPVTLTREKPAWMGETDVFGMWDALRRVVYIVPEIDELPHLEILTAFHEFAHMILFDADVYLPRKVSERVAEAMGRGLAELFMRNPELLQWLRGMVVESQNVRIDDSDDERADLPQPVSATVTLDAR
jgi:hypothetical protein